MINEILVDFNVNGEDVQVPVSYKIEMAADIQLITCTVCPGTFHMPTWLQMRKFEFKSMLGNDGYMPLFTDNQSIKNINASMFIDKTYQEIMQKEKFVMDML